MKKIIKLSLFVLVILIPNIGRADVTNGLINHWQFENNANDSVGTNNGTLLGGANYVSGKVGNNAISFETSGSSLNLNPISTIEKLDAISVSFWLKPILANTNVDEILVSNSVNTNQMTIVVARNSNESIEFNVKTDNASAKLVSPHAVTRSTDWHHVVAIYDGNEISVFINGQKSGSSVALTGKTFDTFGNLVLKSNIIDDLRFYSKALNSSEIAELAGSNSQINPTPTPTPTPTPNPTPNPVEPAPETPIVPVIPPETSGNIAKRMSGGIEFTWEFNCGGRACKYGKFVNGEFWVAPIDDQGKRVPSVTITRISPDGVENGAEVNPSTYVNQGILNGYADYKASLNVMTKLPYSALPGESIFKIYKITPATTGVVDGCRETAGCVGTDDVLTILNDIPKDNGATIFRPPFHGNFKPLFSTEKIKLDRLSKLSYFGSGDISAAVSNVVKTWTVPLYNIRYGVYKAPFYRETSPLFVMNNYAAYQSSMYLSGIKSILGNNSTNAKAPAAYALVQAGIDVYGVYKMGIPFGTGAGQHLGKKPALAFFAALYDDRSLLEEVRGLASNETYLKQNFFQEDSQIKRGNGGVALWGDLEYNFFADETAYWFKYISQWLYENKGIMGYDGNGAAADPYGYIDGPAGGPATSHNSSARTYQPVSSPYLVGYAFTQLLFPWYRYAAGDNEIIEYADRLQGRIPGFAGGYWAKPDLCADVDDRESVTCDPRSPATCNYYSGNPKAIEKTWGPDPLKPGQCIHHKGDPMTDGRRPQHHGAIANLLKREGKAAKEWTDLRDCLDPAHSSYPCAGLGPEGPDGNPPIVIGVPTIPQPPTPTPPQTPDTTSPTVSITSPVSNSQVSGISVPISIQANDNVAVVGVQLKVNGTNLPPELTSPYTGVWNTTSLTNGTYTLTAVARDSAGNTTTSNPVTVTVNNIPNVAPTLTVPSSRSVNEGSTLTFTVSATDTNNDLVTYSVTNLPTGATFTNQIFTWTPSYTQSGTYTPRFTASDGELQDTETVSITVNNVDQTVVVDTDKDGVNDTEDRCPSTPTNTQVNSKGCVRPKTTKFTVTPNLTTEDLNAVSNLSLSTNYGKVVYSEPISLNKTTTALDIDAYLTIDNGVISLESRNIPELNKPATLHFYNVDIQNPEILKDSDICEECHIISYTNKTLVFTVPGFSVYRIVPATTTTPVVITPAPVKRSRGGGGSSRKTGTLTPSTQTASVESLLALIAQLQAQISAILASRGQAATYTTTPTISTTNTTSTYYRNLSQGMSGNDVNALQKYLNSKGYTVSATGYFGPLTKIALMKFQQDNGITPASGLFGPVTRSKIK